MSSGWGALAAAIEQARALIAAAAPDAATAAEGEAYLARVLAASLADPLLGPLLREDGLGRATPVRGGPNPDYRMHHAAIDPAGRYRLSGQLNGSERVGVGLYAVAAGGAMSEQGYAVFAPGSTEADGRFMLEIAADASGPGTLAILPGTRVLLIRTLHRDPAAEPARLDLSPVAAPSPLAPPGAGDAVLNHVARAMPASIAEYLKWTRIVSTHPNRFAAAPPELAASVQGDPDTQYFLGAFDLGPGEWLEARVPPGLPGYWSVHAYNYWFEGLQTPGVHDRNASAGEDGAILIRIGPGVPADLPNRIDTAGRSKGALICRIIGASPIAPPETRIVRDCC